MHEHKNVEIKYSDERATLTQIFIRDLTPEKTGDTYIYHDFRAYLVNLPLPSYSRCVLDGYMVDDEQGNIIILVYGVEPVQEEFQNFKPTSEDEATGRSPRRSWGGRMRRWRSPSRSTARSNSSFLAPASTDFFTLCFLATPRPGNRR